MSATTPRRAGIAAARRAGAAAAGLRRQRLDALCNRIANRDFDALLVAAGGYFPSIRLDLWGPDGVALADAYDAAQAARQDARRAFRTGDLEAFKPEPAPPAKRRGECQVCARAIALSARGAVVKHGHSIVGKQGRFGGFHTADCDGSGFLPCGLACDALPTAILRRKRAAAANRKAARGMLDGTPDLPGALELTRGTRGLPVRRADVTPADPTYERVRKQRVEALRRDAEALEADAAALQERLAAHPAPAPAAE